jgi:microcompartment protein CcmL/EutN
MFVVAADRMLEAASVTVFVETAVTVDGLVVVTIPGEAAR